jgi:DNA polymerase-3 subunit gamma/tau
MSDQYIVSARKYRPITFDTVIGQEHITTTLKNSIRSNHLAHAFLFCGPRGVGKTTCARILAKTLNCENPTDEMEACGNCSNCQSFNNNTSFNVFELDAASNNSVDDIRSLTEQVRFAPQQGRYKVYIIDEVHMLSAAAFNAFLKTLEEPPSYAIFILATTEKHKILPTILSRCQIFDFKRITTSDTVKHLQQIIEKENILADEASLHVIAQKSEGCMRDALSMLDRISSFTNGQLTYASTMEHLNQLDADFYFKITDFILSSNISSTLLLLDEVLDKGFEGDTILEGFEEHFRNLLLCKDPRMAKLLDIPNNHKPIYYEKAGQAPPSFILSALNVLNSSTLEYKNANNRRLHTELCLIRLCYLLKSTSIDQLNLEKKNADSALNAIEISNNSDSDFKNPSIISEVKTESNITKPIDQEPLVGSTYSNLKENNNSLNEQHSSTFLSKGSNVNTRRISKNMLSNSTIASEEIEKMNISELTIELVLGYFEQFKKQLRDEQKNILFNAFEMIQIEMNEDKSLHFISPNNITDSYVQSEKSTFQDLLKKETGLLVSISNSFTIQEAKPKNKAMSKNEIFAAMSEKNPMLLQLKESLKLGIDY